jgi:phosphoenolpyruvate carboxykinase (GTP)
MRVLKWILNRLQGLADGDTQHLFGNSPNYGDLNWECICSTDQQLVPADHLGRQGCVARRAEAAHGAVRETGLPPTAYRLPQELVTTKRSSGSSWVCKFSEEGGRCSDCT